MINQEKQEVRKVKRCKCNKQGYIAWKCYSERICKKCNKKEHIEKVCNGERIEKEEE